MQVGIGVLAREIRRTHDYAIVPAAQARRRVGLQRDHQIRADVVAHRSGRVPLEKHHGVFVFGIVGLQNLSDVALGSRHRV